MMTLEQYFKTSHLKDHMVRHEIHEDGTIQFQIFQKDIEGTMVLDFIVKGNWIRQVYPTE